MLFFSKNDFFYAFWKVINSISFQKWFFYAKMEENKVHCFSRLKNE